MTTPVTTRVGPALFLAAGLVGGQALVSIGFGVFELTQIQPQRPAVGVTAVLTLLLYGALLAAVGYGLFRSRSWSRGPAVATQILHLPIAWSFASGATLWVAALLAVTSVTALVCVLLPSSTRLLARGPAGVDSESEPAADDREADDDQDAADERG